MKQIYRFLMPCIAAWSIIFLGISCSDDDSVHPVLPSSRSVTILAVNDMHANIEHFPRFAFIADSLRNIYPELLVVSAGDNQTGHPANDQYVPRGLPVIELMNAVGFNLSAVGNHELDMKPDAFSLLTRKADFDFLCSNMKVPAGYSFKILPYRILRMQNGVKIGIASLLQLGIDGIPSCNMENTAGFTFQDPFRTAQNYIGMKDSCDIVIFLNHLGYSDDVKLAEQLPKGTVDVIIGGHTNEKIENEEFHNGILITQAGNKLKYASLIKLQIKTDGEVEAHMEWITVGKEGNRNKTIEKKVQAYQNNPAMKEPLAALQAPLSSREQLGYLMADAMRDAAPVDFSLVNAGGVRSDSWDFETVTVYDVYLLDPFGNTIITVNFSGEELYRFFRKAYEDKYHWIYASGLKAEYTVKGNELADIKLFTTAGEPLDRNATYKVSMNNFMISSMKIPHRDKEVNIHIQTAENMIRYLKKIKTIKNYQSEDRLKIIDL